MSGRDDNIAVMRRYAEAWQRGEPEAAFALYADDVVMHLPGKGPAAGVHRGRDAVVACISGLLERSGDLQGETLDTLVSGDRVALVVHERGERDGRTLDIQRVNLYSVQGGRITEIRVFEGDQHAVDAFFGDD